MSYRGAWAKASTATLSVPLKPAIDPEHSDPSVAEVEGTGPWTDGGKGAPTLPDALTPEPEDVVMASGFGPLDQTPDDPELGVGSGHGQTTQEAQQVRTVLMEQDYGAVAAHAWNTQIIRDGHPHAVFVPNTDESVVSTMAPNLRETGVTVDPQARRGRGRIKRWYDRVIDMHWYQVAYRPQYQHQAYTAQDQPPSTDNRSYTSPFATAGVGYGTPDTLNARQTFVAPQLRRTPEPWDQALTTDATDQPGAFGLGSWGL